MPTNGLSFYEIQVSVAPLSINFAFDALTADDISVVVIATNDARLVLEEGTHYSLDFANKTITCLLSSWTADPNLPIYSSSDIRIYRTTSVLPLIDFKPGAVLNEGDLDTAYKQGLFAAQEMVEDAAGTGAGIQSVTSAGIANGAVISDKIATDAVTTVKIDDGAVTSTKLATNSVTAFQLAATSVDSSKLVNNSVITAKLADNAVQTAKIANANVTQAKVDKASQSQMESQSSTDGVVTPDVLKYSPFSPRCYGSVGVASNTDETFVNGYNVASVSANTAERTINFTEDLDTTDYVVLLTIKGTGAAYNAPSVVSKATSGFVIDLNTTTAPGRAIDFVVFGSTYPNP